MYLGHAFVGFLLGVALARVSNLDDRRSLQLGLIGLGFATIPDVDMWHTAYVVLRNGPTNVFPTTEYVWPESWIVHRTLTHSIVTGGAVAIVGSAYAVARRRLATPPSAAGLGSITVASGVGAWLAWIAFSGDGPLGLVTITLYAGLAICLAEWALRLGLRPLQIGSVAALGLVSHPFGDLWMGRPPAFGYPFVAGPPIDRVYFSTEPTFNLLAAFGVEIALASLAAAVALRLAGHPLGDVAHPVAGAGVVYAGAIGFVTPPTFDIAYGFAIGLLGVSAALGGVAALSRVGPSRRRWRRFVGTGTATALVAAAVGLSAYAVAYGLVETV